MDSIRTQKWGTIAVAMSNDSEKAPGEDAIGGPKEAAPSAEPSSDALNVDAILDALQADHSRPELNALPSFGMPNGAESAPQLGQEVLQLKPDALTSSRPASVAGLATERFELRSPVPVGDKTGPVLGIDLGTTNSCIALEQNGDADVLSGPDGSVSIPSVVFLPPSGTPLLGPFALARASQSPDRTLIGTKRLMGRAFHSPVVGLVRSHVAYEIAAGSDGEAAVQVDGEIVTMEEVAAEILLELRSRARAYLNRDINRAVITCPAHFNQRQKAAVRRAGELAGWHVERVLSEPTAAALAFGVGRLQPRKVLVYDLGGGTFDVSLLEVEGAVYEVLAGGGDAFLGGVDFDAAVSELLVKNIKKAHGVDLRVNTAQIARVLREAERAKCALSLVPTAQVDLKALSDGMSPPFDFHTELSREAVDQAVEPLIDQTLQIVQNVLDRAEVQATDVHDVLLVGGMTRYPFIRRKVTAFFKKAPMCHVNPDHAVALGAAMYGASLERFDTAVLLDRLSMSIGIGRPGGTFVPVVFRDTRLPASESVRVPTSKNNQRTMELLIFQGDAANAQDNEPLGRLVVNGLPRAPAGRVEVEVRFQVTEEGLLHLSASVVGSMAIVSAQLATKDTPEALRQRLGLPSRPTLESLQEQEDWRDRPKKVWGWLSGLFR